MRKLLLCGEDQGLLDVRAAVLRKGGSFEVPIVVGVARLMEHPLSADQSLVVLCNSLNYPDRIRAERWIEEELPSLPVITLTRADDPSTNSFKHAVPPGSAPDRLLNLRKELAV